LYAGFVEMSITMTVSPNNFLVIDQVTRKLIQAGSKACSDMWRLISSVQNKEDVLQQQKEWLSECST
jgi:hypothetical protein